MIVGNIGKVNEMIDNVFEQERYTSFTERIREFAEEAEKEDYLSMFDEDIENYESFEGDD